MIRRGKYKYVFYAGDIDELYDLEADPHELTNLAPLPETANILLDMRQRLGQWI